MKRENESPWSLRPTSTAPKPFRGRSGLRQLSALLRPPVTNTGSPTRGPFTTLKRLAKSVAQRVRDTVGSWFTTVTFTPLPQFLCKPYVTSRPERKEKQMQSLLSFKEYSDWCRSRVPPFDPGSCPASSHDTVMAPESGTEACPVTVRSSRDQSVVTPSSKGSR